MFLKILWILRHKIIIQSEIMLNIFDPKRKLKIKTSFNEILLP